MLIFQQNKEKEMSQLIYEQFFAYFDCFDKLFFFLKVFSFHSSMFEKKLENEKSRVC